MALNFSNPQCMCKGYSGRSLCACGGGGVWVCVVPLLCFKRIFCVDFTENALFSSFGIIHSQLLPLPHFLPSSRWTG